MDHLFCSCVRCALLRRPFAICIAIAAGISIFHFWLSLLPSYPYFVSQWISFLSSPPSRARTLLCIFCAYLLSSLFRARFIFLFLFFFSSFLLGARIFFSHDAVEYARLCQTQRAVPSPFDFPREFLRPL